LRVSRHTGRVAIAVAWVVGLTLVLGSVAAGVLCVLKGKWLVGLLALPLAMTGVPVIAAVRLARPDSWWARRKYDSSRADVALQRWAPRSRKRLVAEILMGSLLLLVACAFSTVVP
jgi:hypothetical protein